jgi:hypothetical protein
MRSGNERKKERREYHGGGEREEIRNIRAIKKHHLMTKDLSSFVMRCEGTKSTHRLEHSISNQYRLI